MANTAALDDENEVDEELSRKWNAQLLEIQDFLSLSISKQFLFSLFGTYERTASFW